MTVAVAAVSHCLFFVCFLLLFFHLYLFCTLSYFSRLLPASTTYAVGKLEKSGAIRVIPREIKILNAEEVEMVEAWEALEEAEMVEMVEAAWEAVEVVVVRDDNFCLPCYLNCLILFCLKCYGCCCCICYNEEMDRIAGLSED